MKKLVATALLLATFTATGETGNPLCIDIDHPFQGYSTGALRDIAGSCADPAMKELLERRAQHLQLVEDHAFFDRLERTGRSVSDWNMVINQVFLSLVEVFTGAADLSTPQRLSVLHTAYARANEIADLRLRGYDPQASHLDTWDPATLLMKTIP